MTVPAAPSLLNRVQRAGAFLAIVWGVAASFVAFDMLSVFGVGRLVRSGGPFESLGLPSALTSSEVCRADRDDAGRSRQAAPSGIRAGAWTLGVHLGLHARAASIFAGRNDGPAKERAQEFVTDRRRMVDALAASLNVPPPGSFTPAAQATTNVDFVPFVEGAANQTARALAVTYGSQACELYKMGAYWGFSVPVRTMLPGEPNVMAAEITYYARRLKLPESLWRPMVGRSPADASGEALAADADAATERLTSYLQNPPADAAPPR